MPMSTFADGPKRAKTGKKGSKSVAQLNSWRQGFSSNHCQSARRGSESSNLQVISHFIHGGYIYANIPRGYIDGIHGTPYIAAPWIRLGSAVLEVLVMDIKPLYGGSISFGGISKTSSSPCLLL